MGMGMGMGVGVGVGVGVLGYRMWSGSWCPRYISSGIRVVSVFGSVESVCRRVWQVCVVDQEHVIVFFGPKCTCLFSCPLQKGPECALCVFVSLPAPPHEQ